MPEIDYSLYVQVAPARDNTYNERRPASFSPARFCDQEGKYNILYCVTQWRQITLCSLKRRYIIKGARKNHSRNAGRREYG